MISIVCYEEVDAWILGKIAKKIHQNLDLFQEKSEIAKSSNPLASLAHHIIYYNAPFEKIAPYETVMITHLDTESKIAKVKKQLRNFQMGICMSGDHMEMLVRVGLPRERLCYVTPAHDEVIKPKPIVLGIASKTHSDGRKNEWSVIKSLQGFPPGVFVLKIMGKGWDEQVNVLLSQGFQVEYHDKFDYDLYVNSFMPSLDYWLYFSHDEGSMAFQDAIAADVKIIATPQGYHLDVFGGIDYVINDMNDLHLALKKIYNEQQARIKRISRWTWPEYTWRHLVIWDYLRNSSSLGVKAEENVFMKLLPKVEAKNSDFLKYQLMVQPVPDKETLIYASQLADNSGFVNLANQYKRQALVYYPKDDDLRGQVMELYPNVKQYCP